jgi:hypothetical protein
MVMVVLKSYLAAILADVEARSKVLAGEAIRCMLVSREIWATLRLES